MTVASVQPQSDTMRLGARRLSLEMAGFFAVIVGAWGGIVPFVGPLFGYSADGSGSWHWNLEHALLFVAPGAAAVVAGLLIMMGALSRVSRSAQLAFAGTLAAVCGAWLIVGPLAWPVLQGTNVFVSASAFHELEYWVGYSLGPGGLLLALGAFVLGRPR
jgi:hypothetical protein